LEKVHGTSAHLTFKPVIDSDSGSLTRVDIDFFSGGTKHETFVKLFDQEALKEAFKKHGIVDRNVTVYGESYGGKEQGMSATYGSVGKFVAFDVLIGECWLDVPNADQFVRSLGLEFVHYTRISTDLAALDAARDADSVQAIRNGVGPGKKMEGVVLRPLVELTKNNGSRVIVKHKRDEFKETATARKVEDPAKLQVLADASAVANEWVTAHRLEHVLQKLPGHDISKMREIIAAMTEDVLREGSLEIVDSPEVRKSISQRTAVTYKEYLKSRIGKV
jgi:hypothetical protein